MKRFVSNIISYASGQKLVKLIPVGSFLRGRSVSYHHCHQGPIHLNECLPTIFCYIRHCFCMHGHEDAAEVVIVSRYKHHALLCSAFSTTRSFYFLFIITHESLRDIFWLSSWPPDIIVIGFVLIYHLSCFFYHTFKSGSRLLHNITRRFYYISMHFGERTRSSKEGKWVERELYKHGWPHTGLKECIKNSDGHIGECSDSHQNKGKERIQFLCQ